MCRLWIQKWSFCLSNSVTITCSKTYNVRMHVMHVKWNRQTITHIGIGSGNGLSPVLCQAIIWPSTHLLLIWPSQSHWNIKLYSQERAFRNVVWKISTICSSVDIIKYAGPICNFSITIKLYFYVYAQLIFVLNDFYHRGIQRDWGKIRIYTHINITGVVQCTARNFHV